MQREQVLVAVVAATALLSFGVAADGLGTDPPPVGQQPEQTGDQESLRDLPELWEFPACDPCDVDTQPLVGSAAANLPPIVLAGLAALGVLAIGGAYLSAGNGDDDIEPDPDDDGSTVDPAVRAGGDAATAANTPDVPLSNEVYRAWRDMAERVPAGRSATPAEYDEAARAQGLPADAVATLTAEFRAVRYGGADPTEERERRAREARDALDDPDDIDVIDDPDDGGGAR